MCYWGTPITEKEYVFWTECPPEGNEGDAFSQSPSRMVWELLREMLTLSISGALASGSGQAVGQHHFIAFQLQICFSLNCFIALELDPVNMLNSSFYYI